MRRTLSLFLLAFFIISCKSSDVATTTCHEKVKLEKEWLDESKADKEHVISTLPPTSFAVHFIGTFDNDALKVSINEKTQKINIEKTDEADETTYACVFSRVEQSTNPILKIESVKKNGCLSVNLDWKYRLIYVWLENDKWIIRYSNFHHSDNLKN